MRNYVAIIHKDEGSDYGVLFPDFPGCITAGETVDEAKALAQEALEGHIEVSQEHGEAIPEPMRLEKAMAHELAADALAFFLVGIPEPATKAVRLNITLPGDLLHQVDRYLAGRGISRSAFLADAARVAMHPRR